MLSLNTPRKPFLSSLVLLGFLLLTACPDGPEPPQRDTTIRLSIINTGVTTVSLNVSVEDTTDSWTFSLSRNDSIILSAEVTGADTVVRDGGLDPATAYRYRAYWLRNGEAVDSSTEVLATTLDTTSHNFVWTIDTLGNYGSYLNDVAIIDENNIWVVGYIKNDSGTYNAARWNGTEWELVLIDRVVDFDGVFAFSEDEIWFSDGCFIYEYDGLVFSKKWECDWETYGPGQVKNIWGSSTNDIYFVGNSGSIIHYDGSGFTKLETGNEVRLIDVEGTPDGEYVFIVGYDFVLPTQTAAYMIHNGTVELLYYSDDLLPQNNEDFGAVSGVSVYGDTAYFVTYQGLWKYNFVDNISIIDNVFEMYDYYPIIVQTSNDILLIGGGFKYVHFNGLTWDFNNELYELYNFSDYGADLKGHVAAIVGYVKGGSHGVVARGYR